MKQTKENPRSNRKVPTAKANTKPKKKSAERSQQEHQEEMFLIQSRQDAIKEANERIRRQDAERVELLSGKVMTIGELSSLYIHKEPMPYVALFPNSCYFFEQLLRMNWPSIDPKKYVKPAGVGQAILEIIYGRFKREVLPILNALNPRKGGCRARKLFQHLDDKGQALIIQFRDDAIALMATCDDLDWVGFRQKLFEAYGVPYQTELFDRNKQS